MPAGRPSTYSAEKAAQVCGLIAEGMSLRKIAAIEGMPAKETVLGWLSRHPEFALQYAQARSDAAEAFAEEILDIADELPPMTADGKYDSAAVQHQRLRVDTRKWIASKLRPKKYGEKLDVEHAGNVGLTVNVVRLTNADG
jgi:hypothetical protein